MGHRLSTRRARRAMPLKKSEWEPTVPLDHVFMTVLMLLGKGKLKFVVKGMSFFLLGAPDLMGDVASMRDWICDIQKREVNIRRFVSGVMNSTKVNAEGDDDDPGEVVQKVTFREKPTAAPTTSRYFSLRCFKSTIASSEILRVIWCAFSRNDRRVNELLGKTHEGQRIGIVNIEDLETLRQVDSVAAEAIDEHQKDIRDTMGKLHKIFGVTREEEEASLRVMVCNEEEDQLSDEGLSKLIVDIKNELYKEYTTENDKSKERKRKREEEEQECTDTSESSQTEDDSDDPDYVP